MSRTDRILITGASGFVGRLLTTALSLQFPHAQILAIGRDGSKLTTAGVDFRDADLMAPETLDIVEAFAPSLVYHLAAISSVEATGRNAPSGVLANLLMPVMLADRIRRCSPGCMFVFASSGEVYGASFKMREAPLDEDAPLRPIAAYARAKTAAEYALIDMLSDNCTLVNLRLFNHTGPGQDERFVAPAFAAQVARIEAGKAPPVLEVGNLDAVRDFLDVRDVVRSYLRLADCADDFQSGVQTFNVCSGLGVAIREIVEEFRRQAQCAIELNVDPARLRASEIPSSIGSAKKFETRFDWRPEIAFSTTLGDILQYWRGRV